MYKLWPCKSLMVLVMSLTLVSCLQVVHRYSIDGHRRRCHHIHPVSYSICRHIMTPTFVDSLVLQLLHCACVQQFCILPMLVHTDASVVPSSSTENVTVMSTTPTATISTAGTQYHMGEFVILNTISLKNKL